MTINEMPHFIGIGAQRCATTWLAQCLGEHPAVYCPEKKEVQYFDVYYDRGRDWYLDHFADATSEQTYGEYTPDYLPKREAIDRLVRDAPNAKLIIMLRDPVERAASAFRLFKSRGRIETDDLSVALRDHSHLIDYGRYAAQIEYLFTRVDSSQVKIILFDDVHRDPYHVLRDLFRWIDIDPDFECPSATQIANLSLSPWLQKRLDSSRFLRKVADSPIGSIAKYVRKQRQKAAAGKSKSGSIVTDACQAYLTEHLADDTVKLGGMLDRDLSHWLSHPKNHTATA
ncbi:MAG: sulfotransferase [Planctomycetota bacterium]